MVFLNFNKFFLLCNTMKYLKPIQVYYRLYYFARRRIRNLYGFQYPLAVRSESVPLALQPSIASYASVENKTFHFLNLSHTFENGIDWNFAEFGKLWTYNLTYFDYLQQEEMSREKGLRLIYDFVDQAPAIRDGLEPFPISLRGMNWVKFLNLHSITEERIDDSLYAQYAILLDNLEYHLLGNHLLENGFSLLFGAYYFQDERLYAKAKEILTEELKEQILEDGAHFELSPMYHQIMLYRVLDCINLVNSDSSLVIDDWKDRKLQSYLEEKAASMLQWLNMVSYKNGDIPLLNDSAKGIAPMTEQLNQYAKALQIIQSEGELRSKRGSLGGPITDYQLLDSGYRKITKPRYECILDIGNIGPDYIPGHAHADTFNFELYIDGKPFIVDTGLSTYETNARRTEERSTASHNTVEVNAASSSEVWGGFRVADRATVTEAKESADKIVATHNGYMKKFGIMHTRSWIFEDNTIIIKDSLNKTAKAVARLHFHPDVTEEMIQKHIIIHKNPLTSHQSRVTNYQYTPKFNKHTNATMLEISFSKELEITINL